ncbi:unnamed protein product [Sphagnum balticum]|jgi:cyanophycinase
MAGNDSYTNDTDSASYRTLFLQYGLAPQHISLHRDNYRTHADISTSQGKYNLDLINNADIIFFNGGDQAKHIRSWLNDDGSPNQLLKSLKERAINDEIICSGSSAGSMIWGEQTFGDGSAFGTLYFRNSIGLAPKNVTDADINGTGLADVRNGTKSLQYDYNAGKMPAFNFLPFPTDTHFNARGRLGRLIPVLVDFRRDFAFGVDENTSLYYDNGVGSVYGWNGVTFVDLTYAQISSTSYFKASNITGHYLTHGDQFLFNGRKPISAK